MFKIIDETIHITRGDKGVIELSIDDYTFAVGDKIELRVYDKKSLDQMPVLTKEVIVEQAGKTVDIELTGEDTKIGEIQNKKQTYWFEIELNDEETVVGFDDETGPKVLILYPEGAE